MARTAIDPVGQVEVRGEIWQAALAPDSGLEAFLATDDGIAHTTDGGAHWKPAGAPEDSVICLATFPSPEKRLRKLK